MRTPAKHHAVMARDRQRSNLLPEDLVTYLVPARPMVQSCPICGSELIRVHRRLMDRVVSIFTPVHRFRCTAAGCGYECNVRKEDERA